MGTHIFDRGGEDDGTVDVRLFTFYGEEYVWTDVEPAGGSFGLTAEQARTYAADLINHADALDERNAGGGNAPAFDYGFPPLSLPPVPAPSPHNWADRIPRPPRCRCSTMPAGYEAPGSPE